MTGRGRRGRRTARILLFTAIAMDAFVCFLFVTAPSYIGPMTMVPASPIVVVPAVGIAANILGLLWMIRIYRADPEGHSSWWRFDRF